MRYFDESNPFDSNMSLRRSGSDLGLGKHVRRVNKKFLLNTVVGLKSHNRREEEEDCWRQYRLQEEFEQKQQPAVHGSGSGASVRDVVGDERRRRDRRLEACAPRHCRSPTNLTCDEGTTSSSREFWAESKIRSAVTSTDSSKMEASLPVPSMEWRTTDGKCANAGKCDEEHFLVSHVAIEKHEKCNMKRSRGSEELLDQGSGKPCPRRYQEEAHRRNKKTKNVESNKKRGR